MNKRRFKKRVKYLLKKHKCALIIASILCISAIIGALTVLLWYVNNSTVTALPLSLWSMSTLVNFTVILILWELLFVGLPSMIVFGGGGYYWWINLSKKDQRMIACKEDKCDQSSNDNGFGFVMTIAFIIYLLVDGTYKTPFGVLPVNYWILAWLQALLWFLLLIGLPASIIGLLYFKNWLKKN